MKKYKYLLYDKIISKNDAYIMVGKYHYIVFQNFSFFTL